MEIILALMILSLIIVCTIDVRQKRRNYLNLNK